MPTRQKLPRRVPKAKGSREHKARAQNWALELLEANPLRTNASVAAEIGISPQALYWWMKNEEAFKARWNRIKTGKGQGPPDPGSLIDWRREYINLEWQNPHNGRITWTGETYAFQRPICEAWDDPKITKLLIVVPVQHGKTTIIEQGSVHQFCKDPNSRIIGVARSQRHGDERAYAVQQLLIDDELYPNLHQKWGSWISKPERRTRSFYISGRKDAQRSPSMSWYGIQTDTYGARADKILLDDIDSPALGPLERDKYVRTINGAISTRLAPGGKMVYIGTRCGIGDIIEQLKATGEWHVIEMSALNETDEPLWPEMFTSEDLIAIRTARPTEFELLYQNNPSPEGSMLFPPALIDTSKSAFGLGDVGERPDEWEVTLSLDPAPVGRAALVALSHHRTTGEIRVIDLDVRTGAGYRGLFEMMSAMVLRYRPKMMVVEEQGGSSPPFGQYPEVRSFLIEQGTPYKSFYTGANKNDPRVGVGILKDLFLSGRLKIAWGNDEAQRRMKALVDDLIMFQPVFTTKRKFDTVMALWFGCNTIKQDSRASRRYVPDPLAGYLGNRSLALTSRF